MHKALEILLPRVTLDEELFRRAPLETIRSFVQNMNNRLFRMEVVLVISILSPNVTDWIW